MRRNSSLLVALAVLVTAACYHATVETGATPSTTVIKKSFASSWIYGLVPPGTVETASKCPAGIARVETKLSFVTRLVGILTAGIYTPMEIVVTCAVAGSADAASSGQAGVVHVNPESATGFEDALAQAIQQSLDDKVPVFIRIF